MLFGLYIHVECVEVGVGMVAVGVDRVVVVEGGRVEGGRHHC